MVHYLKPRQRITLAVLCLVLYSLLSNSLTAWWLQPKDESQDASMNVLFIIMDDLRPAIRIFGDPEAVTPNMDALGSIGTIFTNTYSQQALCGPSRTSVMTSRRPETTLTFTNGFNWRNVWDFVTLPQFFKRFGYHAVSFGKILHHMDNHTYGDFPLSWSEKPYRPGSSVVPRLRKEKVCNDSGSFEYNILCPVDRSSLEHAALPDIQIRKRVVQFFNSWQEQGSPKPFFAGVGFISPHVPFKFPSWILELFPLETLKHVDNYYFPIEMATFSENSWASLYKKTNDWGSMGTADDTFPREFRLKIKQHYYSAVTYIDREIGKVVASLIENGYGDNTIINIISDHGWSLGEHRMFAKNSNYDVATRVPWIVVDPRHHRLQNFKYVDPATILNQTWKYATLEAPQTQDKPVELLDVFPTLVDLAGLPSVPPCPQGSRRISICTEGKSRVEQVVRNVPLSNDSMAFSQYPRPKRFVTSRSNSPASELINYMGYSVRTMRFRYIGWFKFDPINQVSNLSKVLAEEFYDHRVDADENRSVAHKRSYINTTKRYRQIVKDKFYSPIHLIENQPKRTENGQEISRLGDLRLAIRIFGDPEAVTPNMDALGSIGTIFTNTYSQQALCGPSWTSVMTSRRPDITLTFTNGFNWRNVWDFVTLPQFFKRFGYHAVSFGKILHHMDNHTYGDFPLSWSEKPYRPSAVVVPRLRKEKVCNDSGSFEYNILCRVDRFSMEHAALPDIQIRKRVVQFFNSWQEQGSPKLFFAGVGFISPHVPFKFPSWILELFPLETLKHVDNYYFPIKMATFSKNSWASHYKKTMTGFRLKIKQHYYSAVTYIDREIDKVVASLIENGFGDNTIINIISDHGWSLGEHRMFAKNSNYDVATRVPWIVVDPRHHRLQDFKFINVNSILNQKWEYTPFEAPRTQDKPAELLDVFATLVDLAGLPSVPPCPQGSRRISICTEGKSRVE
eukprot:maker-scaffold180_size281610-snap-gene-1.33 protein:Tk11875 transcript:maker-scaffold180_size281610-snap-gene-1.33-mRNA-1 annotation:"iduronate 2-sulfatase"